jgi:hypothetical protein
MDKTLQTKFILAVTEKIEEGLRQAPRESKVTVTAPVIFPRFGDIISIGVIAAQGR